MTRLPFTLQPFPGGAATADMVLTGCIARHDAVLELTYVLTGDLAALRLAAPARLPARRHRLWLETCFECFLAPAGTTAYWEVNLSPAGHWNVYRFTDYRQGMAEETVLASLPFQVERRPRELKVFLALPLAALVPAGAKPAVGLSAVLRGAGGEISYWAMVHPGPEPDFHRREAFVLQL